jgi:hypothetical protein
MLIHVTAEHTEDNCPGYNLELIPDVLKGLEAREEIAKRHNVKILGFWSGAPDHVFYWLIDADSPTTSTCSRAKPRPSSSRSTSPQS